MAAKIYLVTGANRGIGQGLVVQLLKRPNTTVIAAVRKASDETTKKLENIPRASDSHVNVVKLDSANQTDAVSAAKDVQQRLNIDHVDVVLAVAGIAKDFSPAGSASVEEVEEHFRVNAIGPLLLFQALLPLLKKSQDPKFVAITTGIASLGDMADFPMPTTAYGSSKAALNYIVRKIHFENEGITAFVLSPGWVQTDMGNYGAKSFGMDAAPNTLEESITGILEKVDSSRREATSGTFQSFDGHKYNW